MTDDRKAPCAPLAPIPDANAAPEKQTTAVHDDRLWGGPRQVDGLPGAPVVSTKSEYFRLLNQAGLRMRNQQESTTGPAPEPIPAEFLTRPEIVVPPMDMEEAHIYGAVTAVFKHYDLIETVWCEDCVERNRNNGCRMQVNEKRVLLECRCGHAIYMPPVGTTDLVLSKLANIARTRADETSGTVMTDAGPVFRPTGILHDLEALILRRYFHALRARHKEPRIFHRWCFGGDPRVEDQAVAIAVSPEKIVLVCTCRTLFHQRARVIRATSTMEVM